jgi:PAS domain S-box-containing protein
MRSYRTAVIATLTLTAVALVAVGLATARRITQVNDDARLVEHTQEIIGQVQRVLRLAAEAESSVRAFAITGDNAFLDQYTASTAALDLEDGRLAGLVSDSAEQRGRVHELVDVLRRRVNALEDAKGRRQAGGLDAVRQSTAPYQGKRLMDQARSIAGAITDHEQTLLGERRRQSAVGLRWTRAVALAGTVGAVLALMLAGMQIHRELGKRRAAEALVLRAYKDVEEQVQIRTRDLEAALQQLQASDEQFRVVAELSPVYLFRADAYGACDFISTGFFAFTGLTPERSRGFGWTEAVDAEDRGHLLNAWQVAISAHSAFDAECRFRSKEGVARWFRVRVVPLQPDGQGRIVSWVGAAVDIHELKEALAMRATLLGRAQDAQRESEAANQLKDDFLATVSHELRTPLNAIVGWAHVLTLADVSDAERAHAIDAIQRNAKAQTRLVEDLLDVSSMIRGRLNIIISSVDLRSVAREAVETVAPAARARDVRVVLDAGADPVVIAGDPNRLQQIVWNLLSNAVKFSTTGGHVRIGVDRMGSRGRVRVDDAGEGIDPAFLPHVFEAFRQGPSATMRAGLGLGLAIVRRLVELHGGTISVESEGRGHGASFAVTFPLHTGAPLVHVAIGGARPAGLAGVKVLLAEDDDDSAAALTAVLRLRGCQVQAARTAAECLRVVAGWQPDIFLCDLGLPDDDGYSLLHRVRGTPGYGDAPAIALTAFAGEADRVRALAAGFTAHISKPFDPDVVVREISSALPSRGRPS